MATTDHTDPVDALWAFIGNPFPVVGAIILGISPALGTIILAAWGAWVLTNEEALVIATICFVTAPAGIFWFLAARALILFMARILGEVNGEQGDER